MVTRPQALTALAASAVLLLSACGSDAPNASPQPTAAPTESALDADGTFVLYAGRDETLIAPLIEQFEAHSGITVEVRYAGTTELAALLIEEGSASPAGVFLSQDAGALGAVSKEGLFAAIPADLANAVLEEYTSQDGSWLGITGRARVFAYDSQAYTEATLPTSIWDLTDPRYRGQVAWAPTNASFQSFVTAMRVLEGEAETRAWLEAMIANDAQVYAKNGAILDAVDNGEVGIGLINHYYWTRQIPERGTDTRAQLAFPAAGDPGGIVNVTGAGVLGSAAQDADAWAFLEYLVSAEGQRYFVEQTTEYPLVPGIAAPEILPPLESLVTPGLDLSDLDTLSETTALLAEVGLL